MKKYNLLTTQNGVIGLICIALLFVINYDIGQIGNPVNLTGEYGLPNTTELYFSEDQILPDQLNQLLGFKKITVMVVNQDTGYIYDPA